jgi:CRP/FNR family transcriptional regulator, cyclic AMP receptor protein
MRYQLQESSDSHRPGQLTDKAKRKAPYGLNVISSCLSCSLVKQRVFCQLSKPVLAEMDAISSTSIFPKGSILFVEGQEPRGVFVICNGRLKLSTSSPQGKSIIVRTAKEGEVIGLPSTLSGKPYDLTAEALEPVQANFIRRDAFLQFLQHHSEAALRTAEILSNIYHNTLAEVRYLGLAASAPQKLARFLLDQLANDVPEDGPTRSTMTLTHREIAETVGASRETVTRSFAQFKRKGWIEVHGSAVTLEDRAALENLRDA